MAIFQHKNPPSKEELTKKIKEAFAKMGYDTPEKRKKWYDKQKCLVLWATRIDL